ncbi:hypothetical protein Taro_052473 [Colocasia esculenta]|uniref:RCD1 WWE domain-containing protein n=1 Tax=Colocasia esculenta TaxID=4460 RepID=A0A843XKB8_COLES|nr:hypothetical protein [Colocasia esculenta]
MFLELQGFSASTAPTRISYIEGGAWRELPPEVVHLLREGFMAGRSVVEVSVGGPPRMFDFVWMVQIDVVTAAQKPIPWTNAYGQLFYPNLASRGGPKRSNQNGGVASTRGACNILFPLVSHFLMKVATYRAVTF